MPIYEYKCDTCGWITDKMTSIKGKRKTVPCDACGEKARNIPSVPVVQGEIEPYLDIQTNRVIKSRKHRKEENRRLQELGFTYVTSDDVTGARRETARDRKKRYRDIVLEAKEKCENPEYAKEVRKNAELAREKFRELKENEDVNSIERGAA